MSGYELTASLVASLAWPFAVVVATIVLRKPLAAAFKRLRRVEALGISAELDAVEHAREDVEQELASPERDIDALVKRAADLGWHLGRAAPDVLPGVQIDRSGETPLILSAAEETLKREMGNMELLTDFPAWRRVADQIHHLITSGQLKPGQQLPTLTQIAREYSVGLNTARHAIHFLTNRGILVTMPARGVFVASQGDETQP